MVAAFKEEFGFTSFAGDFDKSFGFENAIRRHRDSGEFAEFFVPIPRVRVKTKRQCSNCKGSGKDKRIGRDECLHCDGIGVEHDYLWHEAYAISASLTVLFMIIEFQEVETNCKLPQLLTVHTITDRGSHGGSLGGMYSVAFCDWLSTFEPHTKIVEMAEAMKLAYGRMLGRKYFNISRFDGTVADENGWLNVSCPGNACGLHPSSGLVSRGEGYEFSSHNVDSPAQQLTLLAGLAALHDKARNA